MSQPISLTSSLFPFQERSKQISFHLKEMAESITMEWRDKGTLLGTPDKND